MRDDLKELIEEIGEFRARRCFPPGARQAARRISDAALALLFPHFSDDLDCDAPDIRRELETLRAEIDGFLDSLPDEVGRPAEGATRDFLFSLKSLHAALMWDARAIYHGDPAADSIDDVILAYPGFFAIAVHRVAHRLYELGYPLLPRLVSEYAHERTGIDIHPGATLGRSFGIDHGTGVVIGATAVVGNGVKLFQGVTLGALQVDKHLANRKRHPTIEDNVVIYANATILGGDTVIGHDTIIGASAWVTETVPPFSIVGRHSDVRPRRSVNDSELEFQI